MAMFGLGANYDGEDMTQIFIDNGIACVGWEYNRAPALHHIMRSFQVGDIVYLKAHPPHIGLIVKAVGLVRDSQVFEGEHGRACVRVDWVWRGPEQVIGRVQDAYNVYNNTLYQEWNPDVRNRIMNLLMTQPQRMASTA